MVIVGPGFAPNPRVHPLNQTTQMMTGTRKAILRDINLLTTTLGFDHENEKL
jgi:hypothetical protein